MEESEKRRERLRALRLQSQSQSQLETLTPNNQQQQQLGNPLVDYEQQQEAAAARFDYYTDPLSAYSSHKQPPQQPYPGSGSTYSRYAPHYNANANANANANHHHPEAGGGGVPYYTAPPFRPPPPPLHHPQPASPYFASPPPFPLHQGTSNFTPHAQPRPPSPLGYGPPTSERGRRPQWDAASRYSPATGRGRDHAHAHTHAPTPSTSSYDRSMLEDPWKFLKPVIWQSHAHHPNTWGSVKLTSIAQGSIGTKNSTAQLNRGQVSMSFAAKKPRLSDQSTTQPSLAEFLAAAAAAAEAEGGDS